MWPKNKEVKPTIKKWRIVFGIWKYCKMWNFTPELAQSRMYCCCGLQPGCCIAGECPWFSQWIMLTFTKKHLSSGTCYRCVQEFTHRNLPFTSWHDVNGLTPENFPEVQFNLSDLILWSLPAKINQSHLSSLISRWVHEKTLTSPYHWLAHKK